MAAATINCVILVVFLLPFLVLVRSEYLVGYSQKTIKVPLTFPRPSRYAVISVKSKAKFVTGMNRSNSSRVSFSASYLGHLNRWSLEFGPELNQSSTEKTLCMDPETELKTIERNDEDFILAETSTVRQEKDFVYIVVYSRTMNGLEVDVEANWNTMFMISLNETVQIEVDPHTTKVFQFLPDQTYGNKDETFLITVDSIRNNKKCMYVAINDPGCPWHDTVKTIQNSKMWARMLKTGFFPIKSKDFPSGFTITLITLRNSSDCHSKKSMFEEPEDLKIIDLKIDRVSSSYSAPVSISIVFVLSLALMFSSIWFLTWHFWKKQLDDNIDEPEYEMAAACSLENQPSTQEMQEKKEILEERCTLIDALSEALMPVHFKDFEGPDQKEMTIAEAAIRRLKKQQTGDLTLEDMSNYIKENIWHRRSRSRTYLLLVPLLSLFYLIPSFQMVYAEFQRSAATGDMERCYLNFGCARPWGIFPDFNHTISNSGYIIYGIVFIAIVYYKSCGLPSEHQPDRDHNSTRGLLQQYSMFYTLGLCLILQGAFSIIFHICPSNVSLQFDTTMMYMMMILVFIKTYQFRHPDTSASAYNAMYSFFILLLLEAMSLYITKRESKIIFYAVCGFIYLAVIIHLSIDNYFYGALKISYKTTIPILCSYIFACEKSRHPGRLSLMICFFIFNLLLLVVISLSVLDFDDGVSSLSATILLLCSVNVGLYLSEYLLRKIYEIKDAYEGKKIIRFSILFVSLLLCLIVGFTAGMFYSRKLQSRNLTPPESRDRNQLCSVGDFFDNHDMWHFLSSTALFLAFIFLLTIDDDLFKMKRSGIKVF